MDILDRAWPLLQAEDQIMAMTAARAAQLDRHDYARLLRQYENMAAPYSEPVEVKLAEGEDKARAIEFFRQAGAKLE